MVRLPIGMNAALSTVEDSLGRRGGRAPAGIRSHRPHEPRDATGSGSAHNDRQRHGRDRRRGTHLHRLHEVVSGAFIRLRIRAGGSASLCRKSICWPTRQPDGKNSAEVIDFRGLYIEDGCLSGSTIAAGRRTPRRHHHRGHAVGRRRQRTASDQGVHPSKTSRLPVTSTDRCSAHQLPN